VECTVTSPKAKLQAIYNRYLCEQTVVRIVYVPVILIVFHINCLTRVLFHYFICLHLNMMYFKLNIVPSFKKQC